VPPSATSELNPFDPARRYKAIQAAAIRTRATGESYDMLEALVESVYAAEQARFEPVPIELADGEEPAEHDPAAELEREKHALSEVERGVRAAITSYDVDITRSLFDACLLAGATETELAQNFSVDPLETAAYRHLFFDRNVFPNAFHLSHYIASRPEAEQTLLRIAQTQGFNAIAMQYGMGQPISPEIALTNMLAADTAAHRKYRELPISHQSTKDVRALAKQITTTAQAIHKVQESKSAAAERLKKNRTDEEFVLVPGPRNPTLAELMAMGGAIATPGSEKV
jgi:hypothetical protein